MENIKGEIDIAGRRMTKLRGTRGKTESYLTYQIKWT